MKYYTGEARPKRLNRIKEQSQPYFQLETGKENERSQYTRKYKMELPGELVCSIFWISVLFA